MTEKEQALKIWNEYLALDLTFGVAKKCALICINEVLLNPLTSFPEGIGKPIYSRNWWEAVKQEIETL